MNAIRRGGFAEPYCSDDCFNKAGREIGAALLPGIKGTCGFCKRAVTVALGSDTKLIPYRRAFLFICSECQQRGGDYVSSIRECCFCGALLPEASPSGAKSSIISIDSLESFFCFAGLSYGDTLTDVVRLYGNPDSTEDIGDPEMIPMFANKFFGELVTVQVDGDTKHVSMITIGGSDGADSLRRRGIRDEKLSFIGQDASEIESVLGVPRSATDTSTLDYEFKEGNDKSGSVSFTCPGRIMGCNFIVVSWLSPAARKWIETGG